MELEDYSNIDCINCNYIENNNNDITSIYLEAKDENNIIISFNIKNDLLSVLKKTNFSDNVQVDFEIPKEYYLSIIDKFK